ncbi:MAG: ATP/GTP-binding protein [Thaumarchaeota archaeon]|nr:ATP/GTP-binding protein [Nitrososphaerota archaeon]
MKVIFIVGTAGAGKSLLTSRIYDYYTANGVFCAILNLDPGVESIPYTCDIDVRDYVDLISIMKKYDLGPNGALIMAYDLIASKLDEIQKAVDEVNPDYLIVDTPGQMELFAYRSSGPFFVHNLNAEQKVAMFLYDGAFITTPANFISITLLATSIKLRLKLPTINVLTKTDLIQDKISDIFKWSSDIKSLEERISVETDGETYTLLTNILKGLDVGDFVEELIGVSNITGEGMINLEIVLSRILNLGEEVED